MSDLFLIASKDKIRFNTPFGNLTTEQLWGLPLTSNSKNTLSLDAVAVSIYNDLEKTPTVSFVNNSSTDINKELTLKLDIVKAIINIKQEELKVKVDKLEKAETIQRLQSILNRKTEEALDDLSIEDIKKKLQSLQS